MADETMVTTASPADTIAATAATTPAVGKPADAVADAAKSVDEAEEVETALAAKEEAAKEEKKDGIAPPAKIVPEKYEIKAPEGLTIDDKAMEKFTPVFKELGLSQVDAQKLVDAYAPYMKEIMEARQQENLKVFKDMVAEWGESAKKEQGADYSKKLSVAAKLTDKFGDPEFREMLNETGVGNHPAMIRFMIKVGNQFAQDSLADSGMKKSDDGLEAAAKKLFPTMNQ